MALTPSQAKTLYTASETVPADIRGLAARLRDGGHNRFRTRIAGESETASWLEAVKNPVNEQWRIQRCRNAGERISREDEVGQSVCFFDALHYCASFELLHDISGDPPAEKIAHYSEAARAADIPLDDDGLPHPAASGAALTPGLFSPEQEAIAARTENKELPAAPSVTDLPALAALFETGTTVEPLGENLVDAIAARNDFKERSAQIRQPYETALEIAQKNVLRINYAIAGAYKMPDDDYTFGCGTAGFVSGFGLVPLAFSFVPEPVLAAQFPIFAGAGLCGLMVTSTIGSRIGSLLGKQERLFYKANRALTESAGQLPPESAHLVKEFARAAEAVFLMGHVSVLQNKISSGRESRRSMEKLQKKGLVLLDEMAQKTGMNATLRDELKEKFRTGAFPSEKELEEKISGQCGLLIDALKQHSRDAVNKTLGAPAPALPS